MTPEELVGPSDEENGVPVGYARTEDGAAAAAREFSQVMSRFAGDEGAHRSALQTLAAPDWRDRAIQLAENNSAFLTRRYGNATSRFVPVSYRVRSFSQEAATVSVWGVSVVGGSDVQRLEESWVTGTLRLIWIGGDWRVTGSDSDVGPTPRLMQLEDGLTFDSLKGFKEYE